MMLVRRLTAFEKYFHSAKCMIQLGLEVSDATYVPKVVKHLGDTVVGLHLKTDGRDLIETTEPFRIVTMPESYSSLESASSWLSCNHDYPLSDRLGLIGVSKNKVILSISHLCADGGYFVDIVNGLKSASKAKDMRLTPVEHLFAKEMKLHDRSEIQILPLDTTISRLYVQREGNGGPQRKLVIPANELACYDRSTQTLKGLTEALWGATVVSCFAFNERVDSIGCATCVNMRPFMNPKDIDWSVGNCYSSITVRADVKPHSTVGDVVRQMRCDLQAKLNRGCHYEYFNAMVRNWNRTPLPGSGCEVSNVGPFSISDPIRDVHIGIHEPVGPICPYYTLLSHSVQNEKKNNVVVQISHVPPGTSIGEMDRIEKSVDFFMRNVSFETDFLDAFDRMRKVQGSVSK